MSSVRKIAAVFSIYLSECFAYPAASFIWVLIDAQLAILLPAVWLAASNGQHIIAGLDRSQLVTYYLLSMTLSQFITCHLMWDIAWDIREGFFTSCIVRPLSFFQFSLGRNFAWRISKLLLFTPLAAVVFWSYLSAQRAAPIHMSLTAVVAVILAQLLSFVSAYCMSLVTLWTVEFESILRIYSGIELFMSGRIFPLSAFPAWAGTLSSFLHFKYVISFPVQMLLGNLSQGEIAVGLVAQCCWIGVFLVLARILFIRGVMRYNGVGM